MQTGISSCLCQARATERIAVPAVLLRMVDATFASFGADGDVAERLEENEVVQEVSWMARPERRTRVVLQAQMRPPPGPPPAGQPKVSR